MDVDMGSLKLKNVAKRPSQVQTDTDPQLGKI